MSDRVIIVTGSAAGIGEATARLCVAEGAKVLLHGRPAEEETGRKIAAELGKNTFFQAGDLIDPAVPAQLVAKAVEVFGRVDGVVNNAAWNVRSNLKTTDDLLFDKTIAINLRAPLLMIRAAEEQLKKHKGSVVNVGSILCYCGENKTLAYSIAKGGLMTLSRNLADALAWDSVRVNHVNLGWVLTPNEYKLKIAEGMKPGWPEHPPRPTVPTGRLTTPEQAADAIVYWLSHQSRPFTGTVAELEQFPFIGRFPVREGENADFVHTDA